MNKFAIAGLALTLAFGAANADAYASERVATPANAPAKRMFVLPVSAPAPTVLKACHYSNSGWVYWTSEGATCSSNGGDGVCSDGAGNTWTEQNPC